MANFQFRLQKVFEYRELEEQWAKDNYLAKQVARIEAESELDSIEAQRVRFIQAGAYDLGARLELEQRLSKLDDNERAAHVLIAHLQDEEDAARSEWIIRRQEKSALEKLREKAVVSWQQLEDRREQNALDEWAVQRRKMA